VKDFFISYKKAGREKEPEGLTINPRNLAKYVKATALLRQVGPDHYAFAHLTLQEYLAAWRGVARACRERVADMNSAVLQTPSPSFNKRRIAKMENATFEQAKEVVQTLLPEDKRRLRL